MIKSQFLILILISHFSFLMLIINNKKGNSVMKKSYKQFCDQISTSNFDSINQKLTSIGMKPLKIENYQLQVTGNPKKLRTSPWLNKKESFDNRENLYLRLVDLMKSFIRFEEKDFLAYASRQSNLEHLLNKLENLRLHNPEFQILFYLLKINNRKLISIYVRLRNEIITRFGLDRIKFNPVAIHNSSKYFGKQNVELSALKIDYENWGLLAEITKSSISEDMLWWASQGNREIHAVDFVRICLWAHAHSQENPEMTH